MPRKCPIQGIYTKSALGRDGAALGQNWTESGQDGTALGQDWTESGQDRAELGQDWTKYTYVRTSLISHTLHRERV